MIRSILIVTMVTAVVCQQQAGEAQFKYEGKTVLLTDKNFKQAVRQFEPLLVYFYAPWCGMCTKFGPKYRQMSEFDIGVTFGKIDADSNEETGGKYEVSSYPTIKLFSNKRVYTFDDDLEESAIAAFVKRILLTPVESLDRQALSDRLKTADKLVVFVPDGKLSNDVVIEAARSNQFVSVVQASLEDAAEVLKVKTGGLYFLKRNGNEQIKFAGKDVSEKSVSKWMEDLKFDLIVQGDSLHSLDRIFQPRSKPAMIGIFNRQDSPEFEAFAEFANKQGSTGGLLFFVSQTNSTEDNLSAFIGIDTDNRVAIIKGKPNMDVSRYLMDEQITLANLDRFYDDFLEGKIQKHYRSLPTPPTGNGLIQTIVGNTFKQHIPNKDGKLTVVYFHERDCEDCPRVASLFKEVATNAEFREKVVFADMDSNRNDVFGLQVEDTPSIGIYRPGDKKVQMYEGSLKKKDKLEAFIRKTLAKLSAEDSTDL